LHVKLRCGPSRNSGQRIPVALRDASPLRTPNDVLRSQNHYRSANVTAATARSPQPYSGICGRTPQQNYLADPAAAREILLETGIVESRLTDMPTSIANLNPPDT
jgi:hypothetical protein